MKVNIGKLPRDTKYSEFPQDTVFVFEEGERPKRDPKTGELIKNNNANESK